MDRKADGARDSPAAIERSPILRRTLRGLDWLNFFLADVQTGVGPFLAIDLASYGWDEERVGIALTVGSIAGIVTQTPAGALADYLHAKRRLIAGAVGAFALGALLVAFTPTFWSVMSAQVLIGGTSSIFGTAICAISLGIVGSRLFDARQGRNQSFNSAGNVVASVSMGLLGYFISNRSIFFFVALSTLPTLLALRTIRPELIDYDRARGSIMFISSCVVTTQLVISLIASWSGRKAGTWGRKPLLLIAFGVLPIRAMLYTLTDDTVALVAIQLLEGLAAGVFGIGAALSQTIAGTIVHRYSFDAGFLFLAGVAAIAFGILYFFMPETRNKTFLNESL